MKINADENVNLIILLIEDPMFILYKNPDN